MVSPSNGSVDVEEGFRQILPELLAKRELRNDSDHFLMERVVLMPADQPLFDRHGLICFAPCHGAHRLEIGWIDVAVMKNRRRGQADFFQEVILVAADRHHLVGALDHCVVDKPERGLRDHSQGAVAADHTVKKIAVLFG